MKQVVLSLLCCSFLVLSLSAKTLPSSLLPTAVTLSYLLEDNTLLNQNSIRVYPNPAINYIHITDNKIVSKLAVFDLIGKKVKNFSYDEGNKFYVGDLRKGIYLVQLLDENNKVLTTKRISKE